jgi:sugar lactone lactonase YvrE
MANALVSLRRKSLSLGILAAAIAVPALPSSALLPAETSNAVAARRTGNLPMNFEANQGQTDPQVKFLSHGKGYSLFLTDDAAILSLSPGATGESVRKSPIDTLRLELAGANPGLHPQGAAGPSGTANYFLGKDPAKWLTNIPAYSRVEYKSVYSGIDLAYYGNPGQLEYDFLVQSGAYPRSIRLHFDGARKLRLGADGSLEVLAQHGQIEFRKPDIYQNLAGQRKLIPGRFVLLAHNTIGFRIGSYDHSKPLVIDPVLGYSTYLGGSGNDGANAVAVDSVGNLYVAGYANSADFPVSKGAVQPANKAASSGTSNAFVAKLNRAGSALLYATYLGGTTGGDVANAIAIDSAGDAYVTGTAISSDFPITSGALQKQNNSNGYGNAFVAKLNPTGTSLTYSTFLGGSGNGLIDPDDNSSLNGGDVGSAIALDAAGDAYIAGTTWSGDFPTTGSAFQPHYNGLTTSYIDYYVSEAFVAEINPTGSSLIYSTYLGGTGASLNYCDVENGDGNTYWCPNRPWGSGDGATSVAVDSAGNTVVAGYTNSSDFPVTKGSYQSQLKSNGLAAFVSVLAPGGSSLVNSTYLSGSGYWSVPDEQCNILGDCWGDIVSTGDSVNALAIDESGNVYLAGAAASADFPVTTGSFQATNRSPNPLDSNAFAAKLNPTLSALVYSTYLGGSGKSGDSANALAIDSAGNAYIAGGTTSTDFPTTFSAFQTKNACACRSFFTELNSTGTALNFSTFLGGSGGEIASGVALDGTGNAFIAGHTNSSDFPTTPGVFQTVNHAATSHGSNAFLAKWDIREGTETPLYSTTAILTANTNPQIAGQPLMLTAVLAPSGTGQIVTGQVHFLVDGVVKGASALAANQKATFLLSALPVGTHTITASYDGAPHFTKSSASISETYFVPPPAISLATGTYVGMQQVKLSDPLAGVTIYYTTNSGTPTTSSAKYTGPVTIAQSEKLKAIAVSPQYGTSAIAVAGYTLMPPPPTISPAAGTYASEQMVTLSDSLPLTHIYYTTNGGIPTPSSTKYTGPFAVTFNQTVQAIAVRGNWSNSSIASATFKISNGVIPNPISTIAGNGTRGYSGNSVKAIHAELNIPDGLVFDSAGNLYVADSDNNVIRKITPAGLITTVIGTGTPGYSGDGGPAGKATLTYPTGMAFDGSGNLYIADTGNHVIRKVTPAGIISTVAGNGVQGYSGDGGPATKASLGDPYSVAISPAGGIYISDYYNGAIRKITSNGDIQTALPTFGPMGIVFDKAGNLYIAATNAQSICKVEKNGTVVTLAGGIPYDCSGQGGGTAKGTTLNNPVSVILDSAGNLFFADSGNNAIREVAADGSFHTIAGNGIAGFAGDGGPASSAELSLSSFDEFGYVIYLDGALAIDSKGNLYIADAGNDRIRKVAFNTTAAPPTSLGPGTGK